LCFFLWGPLVHAQRLEQDVTKTQKVSLKTKLTIEVGGDDLPTDLIVEETREKVTLNTRSFNIGVALEIAVAPPLSCELGIGYSSSGLSVIPANAEGSFKRIPLTGTLILSTQPKPHSKIPCRWYLGAGIGYYLSPNASWNLTGEDGLDYDYYPAVGFHGQAVLDLILKKGDKMTNYSIFFGIGYTSVKFKFKEGTLYGIKVTSADTDYKEIDASGVDLICGAGFKF
jgi:hypothetical protein